MKVKHTLLALAAMSGAASAATISVNFAESAGHANQQLAAGTTAGLAGYVEQNWNNAPDSDGSSSAFIDSTGAASGVTVTWGNGAGGGWGDATADGDAGSGVGDAQIRRGYIDDNGTGVSLSVTGVGYATYTAIIYLSTDNPGQAFADFTVNGATAGTDGGASETYGTNSTWNGSNTIVVTGLSGDFTAVGPVGVHNGARASVAGFQLVDTTVVPEPSSAALLGLGGLALILRRRK